jgi:hypothetical protein
MDKLIAIGILAFGVYHLWTTGALNELLGIGSEVAPATPQQQASIQAAQALQAELAAYEQNQATIGGSAGGTRLIVGTTTTTAGITTGLASAGAIAGSTALLATGIGAAGALLVWGITQKGWFRGGEEGVKVNPARDAFMDEFVKVYYGDPYSFTREQINEIRYLAMLKAFADARVPATTQEQLMRALYAADTMDEFEPAAKNILFVLQQGV